MKRVVLALLAMLAVLLAPSLTWGDDSRYIRRGGAVRQALDALARMQGYSYTMFCTAELVQ